ncbi:leukemia inhibitory factor receptor-like isoform X2 [Echeneis naucrates]|nr:leukemia inhibitory factor receptor-like isoform X2 [Echeneis naucrates]
MTLNSSDQTILVTWEDDPSCFAVHDLLIYELVVLVADKQVHSDEVAVKPDRIGSTHFWNWTSHLPLQCSSHSVRLSSRYKTYTSPLEQKQTLPGVVNAMEPQVYPRDKVLEVGSRVTFCCVLPAGSTLDKLHMNGYNSSTINTAKISNWTHTLTVVLNEPSKQSCTDVICKSTKHENGACVFVGYPPGDKDLQCETRDLESVECHWKGGRNTGLQTAPTKYKLLGRQCTNESQRRCSQKLKVRAGERNWTLTAENPLGTVKLSDRADLTKRVHMFAPEGLKASAVNARNVSLVWTWTAKQYCNLNLTCQLNVSHSGKNTMSQLVGIGLNFTFLTDLMPNWRYNVAVQCKTTQHFWKWSDWSKSFHFQTKGDVPDALDVWMQKNHTETIITWKRPLANQSHGHIINYTVTWMKRTETEKPSRTTVAHTKHNLSLSLDTTEEYVVTVTARNINGSSLPATIITPQFIPDTTSVNTSWITGINNSFSLSWSASPKASCGYIVDWCPKFGPCIVEWIKVPLHQTNANIVSKRLRGGLRYTLSVYGCTQGAPVLLERREGYASEKRMQNDLFKLEWKQQDSNVEVSWDPVPLTERTAFIQGYILYWSDNNSNNSMVYNVTTGNPETTTLTIRNLKISSYMFTVKALTSVGECGTTSLHATLNSQTDHLVKMIIISLITISILFFIISVICYMHWSCIKQKVCPPIPKPLLTGGWISPTEHSCHSLYVEEFHHSEVDVINIPELRYKSRAPMNGYDSNENVLYVFTPTRRDYYNQLPKNCTPSPILPTTTVPSQSGLPTSPFRSVFPNPTYNLIMEPGYQQYNPEPQRQEGPWCERNSGGYQPQSHTESPTPNQSEEDAVSPMRDTFSSDLLCDSPYILLPQLPSK